MAKRVNTKRLGILAVSILVGGAFGFFIGIITSGAVLPSQYISIPLYVNIPLIILTYLMAVGIHELGHFTCFTRNGVKMYALFLTIFMFVNEDGRWKLKIRPNSVTLIGGIAIPRIHAVKTESEFKHLQKAFSRAIIAGPVTSFVFWLAMVAVAVPVMIIAENIYVKSLLFTFACSLTIITLFLLVTSLFKNEIAIGDFPAYKISKNDSFFVASQLYQYGLFYSEPDKIRRENTYLKELIIKGLSKRLGEQNLHIYTLATLDSLIVEYLTGEYPELPDVIPQYVEFILKTPRAFERINISDIALILWFHIIRFIYSDNERKQEAIDLYTKLKGNIIRKTPVLEYLTKQIEHVLGIADNSQYLDNKDNIRISAAHGLMKNFDGYLVDEIKLNSLPIDVK